jgi:hypothetical protein
MTLTEIESDGVAGFPEQESPANAGTTVADGGEPDDGEGADSPTVSGPGYFAFSASSGVPPTNEYERHH